MSVVKLAVVLVVVVVLVLGAPALVLKAWPSLAKAASDNTYLNLVTITGLFVSAVSLALAFWQFRAAQLEQDKQSRRQSRSRLMTLVSELEINLDICRNELGDLTKRKSDDGALAIPETCFHVTILGQALAGNDIDDSEMRTGLWNAYRQLNTVNSLLEQAKMIRHTEHVASPRDSLLIAGRRRKVNSLLLNVDKIVRAVEPHVERSIALTNDAVKV